MTIRELAEIINGLRKVSSSLKDASAGRPVRGEHVPEGTVLASAQGLRGLAAFLDEAADDLTALIPDVPLVLEVVEPPDDRRDDQMP